MQGLTNVRPIVVRWAMIELRERPKFIPTTIVNLKDMDDDYFFELTDVSSESSGLPMNLYVSIKNDSHGPWLWVQRGHEIVSKVEMFTPVTIEDEPKLVVKDSLTPQDFKLVKEFIQKNKGVLLSHWELEIDSVDLLEELEK